MMGSLMTFYPVVCKVKHSHAQEKSELLQVDALIMQPMELHVYGFCAFGLHPAIHGALYC